MPISGTDPAALDVLPFEQVFREHSARVYRFCLSQVRNAADAEDLAAEVFESALAAYERTRPPAAEVQAWLLRITRNAIIDYRRRHGRRSALLARFFTGGSEADPDGDVEAEIVFRDDLRRALAAMKRLSERDRLLVGLRVAAGLPYAEIAAVLEISEHAATVGTHRAMTRLRARVGEAP